MGMFRSLRSRGYRGAHRQDGKRPTAADLIIDVQATAEETRRAHLRALNFIQFGNFRLRLVWPEGARWIHPKVVDDATA